MAYNEPEHESNSEAEKRRNEQQAAGNTNHSYGVNADGTDKQPLPDEVHISGVEGHDNQPAYGAGRGGRLGPKGRPPS